MFLMGEMRSGNLILMRVIGTIKLQVIACLVWHWIHIEICLVGNERFEKIESCFRHRLRLQFFMPITSLADESRRRCKMMLKSYPNLEKEIWPFGKDARRAISIRMWANFVESAAAEESDGGRPTASFLYRFSSALGSEWNAAGRPKHI